MNDHKMMLFNQAYQLSRTAGPKGNSNWYRGHIVEKMYKNPQNFEQFKRDYENAKSPTVNNLDRRKKILQDPECFVDFVKSGYDEPEEHQFTDVGKKITTVKLFGIPVITIERSV